MTASNHLDHGVGRDPQTGKGQCACGWTGSFHMADVHLTEVKRRWEAHNRRINDRRDDDRRAEVVR